MKLNDFISLDDVIEINGWDQWLIPMYLGKGIASNVLGKIGFSKTLVLDTEKRLTKAGIDFKVKK